MRILNKIIGLSALAGTLGIGNVYGDESSEKSRYDALTEAAQNDGAEVYMVQDGVRLWDATEEIVRSGDVGPCDSLERQRFIAKANNAIANETAKYADQVGLPLLRDAMLSDTETIVSEKNECSKYTLVKKGDGVIGDEFKRYKNYLELGGRRPVVVPKDYLAEKTCPLEPIAPTEPKVPVEPVAPSESVVPLRSVKEPKVYGNGLVGYRFFNERGEAPLSGNGLWIEGKIFGTVGDSGSLVLDVDRETAFSLIRYDDGSGNVRVFDTDVSGSYAWKVNPSTRLALGVNFDGRFAAVEYAGVNANTQSIAVGPEIAVLVSGERFNADTSATLGFGSLGTNIDVRGYKPTSDSSIEAKLDLMGEYEIVDGLFGLGAVGRLESNFNGKTAANGSGSVPSSDSTVTAGAFSRVGDKVQGIVGLDYLILKDPTANYSTNATVVYGGIGGRF